MNNNKTTFSPQLIRKKYRGCRGNWGAHTYILYLMRLKGAARGACWEGGFFLGLTVRPQLFERLITLSTVEISVQSIRQLVPRILIFFLLYRHECFTGKYTTRKIHKNYIRDPSGLFSIISHVSLSMT